MSATAFASVLCAGAAAWLAAATREQTQRRGRLLALAGGTGAAGPWARVRPVLHGLGREWLCLPAAVVPAVAGRSPLPLLAGALAVPLVRRRLRARDESRSRERRAAEVIGLCGALAGELRAGRQPGGALLIAAHDSGGLGDAAPAVLAAARFGGDVPGALRSAARQPGAAGLGGLAACWRVAVHGGAGLATGIDRLESALRAERDQRDDLHAQLAGARSTAGLLAVLPVLGLALGTALGAAPLQVLFHTPAGLGCLLAGAALESAGLWWAMRIVRGAGQP
ncbi:type II secretion system F family protein [Streptomyces sp. GC420]|uniref:type II secretion system F family protein n=1 Tax=Streptomyces sp. GC420 TaxID=2697568 RepID=UPI0028BE25A3|nr:type II secretion system F family protein [Streptomyces sp. GC420]